jgi:hypothetical protein
MNDPIVEVKINVGDPDELGPNFMLKGSTMTGPGDDICSPLNGPADAS